MIQEQATELHFLSKKLAATPNWYMASVATVMTDVFRKNEINLLRKSAKIMRIFDKVDDSKNRGVI